MTFPFPVFSPVAGGAVSVIWTDSAVDGTNVTTTNYTFSSQALGTEAGDRKILVAVGVSGLGAETLTVTLDANGMTALATANIDNGNEYIRWFIIAWPTGTTGEIIVDPSGSGTKANCGISIWSVYGASSTISDFATDTDSDPATGSIDVIANGAVVAYVTHRANSATTYTWTNATEDVDEAIEANDTYHTGASLEYAAAQTGLSVECDASQAGVRTPIMSVIALQPG